MRSKRPNTPLNFYFFSHSFVLSPLFLSQKPLPFSEKWVSFPHKSKYSKEKKNRLLKNGSLSLIPLFSLRRSKRLTSHFSLPVPDLRRAPLSHHHGQPNLLIPSDTQILIQSTTKPPFKSMEACGHPQTPHMVTESPASK